MSILINMKMPESCFHCSCLSDEYCQCQVIGKTIKEDDWFERRPDWCPLIEVPEHGDLIDKQAMFNGEHNLYSWFEIEEQPIVIPADKDGDKNG